MKRLTCLAVMLLCLSGCAAIAPVAAGFSAGMMFEKLIAPAIEKKANPEPGLVAAVDATTAPATISLPPEVHEALEALPPIARKADEAYTAARKGDWGGATKAGVGAALALLGLLARWYYKSQPAPEQEIKLKQEKLNAKTDIKLAKLNGAKK